MNRKIHFRAWDGENMWYPEDNSRIILEFNKISGWNIYPNQPNYKGEYLLGESAKNETFELMQFTGLKDKNGKEIYEGDILKGESNIYLHGFFSEVFFESGSFCVSILYDMTSLELSGFDSIYQREIHGKSHREIMDLYEIWKGKTPHIAEFEIAGNIHQNPELL